MYRLLHWTHYMHFWLDLILFNLQYLSNWGWQILLHGIMKSLWISNELKHFTWFLPWINVAKNDSQIIFVCVKCFFFSVKRTHRSFGLQSKPDMCTKSHLNLSLKVKIVVIFTKMWVLNLMKCSQVGCMVFILNICGEWIYSSK